VYREFPKVMLYVTIRITFSLSLSLFPLSLSHQFVLLLQYVLITDIALNLVQLRIVYDLFELYNNNNT